MAQFVSGNIAIGETYNFDVTESAAYSWLQLEDVNQDTNVRWDWYDSFGQFYKRGEYFVDVPDGGLPSGYWHRAWYGIYIDGYTPEYTVGDWHVSVYIQDPSTLQWTFLYQEEFEITDSVAPVVAFEPVDEYQLYDTFTIKCVQTDDSSLSRITFYYQVDGGQVNENTRIYSYGSGYRTTNSTSYFYLGPYDDGQVINYWAIVTDQSGNITQTPYQTLVIQNDHVSTPDQPVGASEAFADQTLTWTTNGGEAASGFDLEYQYDWGDGTTSQWGALEQACQWSTTGSYKVRVRARVISHPETISQWSDSSTLEIYNTSISGQIWLDENENGLQEVLETRLADVTVNLLNASGDWLQSTVSDAYGKYQFQYLTAGDYQIQIQLPDGYLLTTEHVGEDTTRDSDVFTVSQATSIISLGLNQFIDAIDVGLISNILETEPDQPLLGEYDWADINLGQLIGAVFDGEQAGDWAGVSVASLGDIDGDGYDDFLISAKNANLQNNKRGAIYLVYGDPNSLLGQMSLQDVRDGNIRGAVIIGADDYDFVGGSISAGDFNGDGYQDIIISADTYPYSTPGKAFLLYGSQLGFQGVIDLAGITEGTLDGAVFHGIDNQDYTGGIVRSAGDFDGDGYDDLLISAIGSDYFGYGSGLVFLLYGSADQLTGQINLESILSGDFNGFAFVADDGTYTGSSMAGVGDVNGDGFDDVLIGANEYGDNHSGAAYLLYGTSEQVNDHYSSAWLSYNTILGAEFRGVNAYERVGSSVDGVGDVNGDGLNDLLIGTYKSISGTSQSQSYLIYGSLTQWIGQYDLDMIASGEIGGAIFTSDYTDEIISRSVAAAGDINGDGYDDFMINVYRMGILDNPDYSQIFLVYGKEDSLVGEIDLDEIQNGALEGLTIVGTTEGTPYHYTAQTAGDVNGDGFDDLMFGFFYASPNGQESGQVYLIYGRGEKTEFDSSISGVAWNDENSDGVRDDTEEMWSDLTVYLYSSAGQLIQTAKTDLAGRYIFENISHAGYYYVELDIPSQVHITTADVNTNTQDDVDSDFDPNTGLTDYFVVRQGDQLSGIDVGLYAFSGSIIGETWFDAYGDGKNFSSDKSLSSVIVRLLNENGQLLREELTDENGVYVFDNVYLGSYIIEFVKPDKFTFTIQNHSTTDSNDSDVDYVTGRSGEIVIDTDGQQIVIDAGLRPDETFQQDLLGQVDLLCLELGQFNGVAFHGSNAGDYAGYSVSNAGDVDGDGFDDLLIGAYRANLDEYDVGKTYLIYGQETSWTGVIDLADVETGEIEGAVFEGELRHQYTSFFLSSAGDVNGDGLDDFLIGSEESDAVNSKPQEVYLIYGSTQRFSGEIALSEIESGDLDGAVFIGFDIGLDEGHAVASAGDVDGDGFGDILIGFSPDYYNSDPGFAVLIYGGAESLTGVISLSDVVSGSVDGVLFDGTNACNYTGYSISSAGDVNGDDLDDILIGAYMSDPNGSASGQTYLVYGSTTPFSGTISLSQIAAGELHGAVIYGIDEGDYSGIAVSNAGDVNGDGYDDLLIGAAYAQKSGYFNAGETYLVYGNAESLVGEIELSDIETGVLAGAVFRGRGALSGSGNSVSSAGDVNHDGYADFLIGSCYDYWISESYSSLPYTGSVSLIYGSADMYEGLYSLKMILTGELSGVIFEGIDGGGHLGQSVSNAGDVNGDGFDDFIIGAPEAYGNIYSSGEAYLIYGSDFLDTTEQRQLGGIAWIDTDQDSQQDILEPRLAGVKVHLLDDSDQVHDTTTTDTNGRYLFTDLDNSIYRVQFELPEGYQYVEMGEGYLDVDWIDSDVDPLTGKTDLVDLKLLENVHSIDAGFSQLGTIEGVIWNDLNGNDLHDVDDATIASVVVNLIDGQGNLLDSTITNENGQYGFKSLPLSNYAVAILLPEGYIFVADNQGEDGSIDSDVDSQTGISQIYTIDNTGLFLSVDAGAVTSPSWEDISFAVDVLDEGDTVFLDGTFTDVDGSLQSHSVTIDWGNGQTTLLNLNDGVLDFSQDYLYEDNGVYLVSITVTDASGLSDHEMIQVTVGNVAPVVTVVGDDEAAEGETVSFTGSFTDAGDSDTHTYVWDFGDGSSATGSLTPDHIYADNGVYTVTLTVTDDDAGQTSDTLQVTVGNVAPLVTIGDDQSVDEGDTVSFTGSFTDAGSADTHTIAWDFGDSSTITGTLTPDHIYADNGVYTVTLTVTDDDGGQTSDTLQVIVSNVAPVVAAGDDQSVDEGDTVSFVGSFTDTGSADTHTIAWDLGDGSTSTGTLTPDHVYTDNGVYAVTLTVTDDDGGQTSDTLQVTVGNLAPVVAAGDDQSVDEGDSVSFVGSFTDAGSADTHTIAWNFGDGSTTTGALTPDHIYTDNGNFTVTLTVTDDDGGQTCDTLQVTVGNIAPAVAAGDDQSVDEGDIVSFAGSFTDAGSSDTHTIAWDFGDGSTTTGTLTPDHIYTDNGVYTVTLTVADDDGGQTSDTLQITVSNVASVVAAGDDQSADEGDIVSFAGSLTDVGAVDTHMIYWDFGDGSTTTDTLTPDHNYTDNGVYTVTLTVTDNDGGQTSNTMQVTVGNVAPVVAAGDDQSVDEGHTVSFIGSFTDAGSADTHTISWDFGDGSTTTGTLTPDHVYADNGVFTVTLTVTDDDGGQSSDTLQVTVGNVAPVVAAGDDQSVDEGDIVSFTGSFTDEGSSDTHTIAWDFGDGSTTTGTLVPDHVYTDNGVYTVTLTITDDDGGDSSDTLQITVGNVAPVVAVSEDQTNNEGATVAFSGSFTDVGSSDTHTIAWDFGDGSTDTGTLTPEHIYTDNGVYTVTLTVTDDDGASASNTLQVTVGNIAPAVAAGDDQSVNEGDTVSFTGSFTDAGSADTHTIAWDFGDGSTTTGTLTPDHIYNDNGVYTVTLTVTDDDGGQTSDTLQATVGNLAPAVAAGDDQSVDEGVTVSFAGSFTDAASSDTHTIAWDYGDGGTTTGSLTPDHVYTDNGVYTVTLTITDDDGGESSDTLQITVGNVAPVVSAGDHQSVDEGDTVSFAGSFTDAGAVDTHTIYWDFGDGSTTTGTLTPDHIYSDNGVYTVTLTVADNDGGQTSDTLQVTVANVAPVIAVSEDQTNNEGDTITFSGSFTDVGSSDTHTIAWDFGDGNTATDTLTPDHIYTDNGIYTVTLTVTDDDGASASDTLQVTIFNVEPVVSAGDDQIVDEGQTVIFAGSFTDAGSADTHTILWDFGDGSTITGTLTPDHIYTDNGVYTVTLTVTDDDGGQTSDTLQVTVGNVAPTIDTLSDNQTIYAKGTASFAAGATDIAGVNDPLTYTWNFGDGSIAVSGVDLTTTEHTYNAIGTYTVTLTVSDDDGGTTTQTRTVDVLPAEVAGQYLFFNDSVYDGNGTSVTAADMSAIADGIIALLPGEASDGTNASSYVYGIDGIVIEVNNLLNPDEVTINDFQFAVGNSSDTDQWEQAPTPTLTLLEKDIAEGTDRFFLHWDNQAVINTWLSVVMLANTNTSLETDEVFYFGNLVGDVDGDGSVGIADVFSIWNNRTRSSSDPQADVNSLYDIDKDGKVNISDVFLTWNNRSRSNSRQLNAIQPPATQVQALEAAAPQLSGNRLALALASMQGKYSMSVVQSDSEVYTVTEVAIQEYL
jgi:PKD repeat protein